MMILLGKMAVLPKKKLICLWETYLPNGYHAKFRCKVELGGRKKRRDKGEGEDVYSGFEQPYTRTEHSSNTPSRVIRQKLSLLSSFTTNHLM